jgi:acetate kinase
MSYVAPYGMKRNGRDKQPSVLANNGGSSSIKFALFAFEPGGRRILDGRIEGIGGRRPRLLTKVSGESKTASAAVSAADHRAAADALLRWIGDRAGTWSVRAVGHRFVHGGPGRGRPCRLTPAVLARLKRNVAMDPEHLPDEIALAEAVTRAFPGIPQVACFDTAFHAGLPGVARLLPIPRRYETKGIRRYGFHGLSYQFLTAELARREARASARRRVILAHLGSGASLAAVRRGRSIDTSMGFTPAAGIPMATRSGDLDPGLNLYLASSEGMGVRAFNRMVTAESGLLGMSGTSGDIRDLLRIERQDPRAAQAIAVFCYEAKKCIGAYAAALGGLDTLVFSGGIGEHSPAVRARICQGLEFLGLALDRKANARHAAVISSRRSRVTVRVIPTDEEAMIARLVRGVLRSARGRQSIS